MRPPYASVRSAKDVNSGVAILASFKYSFRSFMSLGSRSAYSFKENDTRTSVTAMRTSATAMRTGATAILTDGIRGRMLRDCLQSRRAVLSQSSIDDIIQKMIRKRIQKVISKKIQNIIQGPTNLGISRSIAGVIAEYI